MPFLPFHFGLGRRIQAAAPHGVSLSRDAAAQAIIDLESGHHRCAASTRHPTGRIHRKGIPTDYILLQSEVGLGVNRLKRTQGQVSVGLSDNLFDVWVTAPDSPHTSRSVPSVFAKAEWELPWNLTLNNRGVVYYARSNRHTGFVNMLTLEKRLTAQLSVGARYEVRRNNPDVRISDFNLLQRYLGLEY